MRKTRGATRARSVSEASPLKERRTEESKGGALFIVPSNYYIDAHVITAGPSTAKKEGLTLREPTR
jgi:hypothetical protein